jgi:hypothetical protein
MLKVVLLSAFVLVFTGSGVLNLYYAIHYRVPPVTSLAKTPPDLLPTYLRLTDITLDSEHALQSELGGEILYVPVRAKGAPPQSPYPVIIQMSSIDFRKADHIATLAYVAALAMRTEVAGRVCSLGSDRFDRFHKELPLLSENAVLIDEGATTHPIFAIVMLAIGLGTGAIALAGGFKKATPSAPQAVAAKG